MKYYSWIVILAAIGAAFYANLPSEAENDAAFNNFIATYGRNYASQDEYNMRKQIFNEQLKKAEEHNAKGLSWTLGTNQFSDWTNEEYSRLLGLKNFRNANSNLPTLKTERGTDESLDWRDATLGGYVGPVLNQGHCGSCWAFSAAQALASSYYKKFGEVVDVSRSHAVDCDKFSHGCNGGLQENAFIHWMRFGAITEEHYPYIAEDKPCREVEIGADLPELPTAFRVDVGDSLLYDALTHQPVSISIRAENDAFRQYTGGIIDGPDCGTEIDHAVLLVGYNAEGNYWIVKNSWGDSWGEDGYVRIARRGDKGICGINQQNSIPVYKDDF